MNVSASYFVFKADTMERSAAGYENYATLFKTIVLDKYTYQIDGCLQDLRSLVFNGIVHPSWIIVLLISSLNLSTGIPDGVRKTVGAWVLNGEINVPESTEGFDVFLGHTLLPWAVQGPLFTASLSKEGTITRCLHGEILCNYIRDLITRSDDTASHSCIRAMFAFLDIKGNNMFRNATLHVLQGLQQGLSANPLSLDIENLQLLLRVSEKVGLSEVAQQALNHLCYALCQHSPYMSGLADTSAGYDTVMARRYNALKARVERVRSTSNQPAAEEVDSLNPFSAASSGTDKPLEAFLHILYESDYQCLKRGGLLQATR